LRTIIFWSHLTAGVIAGTVILVMSVSGVALTYDRQLIARSDRGYHSTAAAGETRLPLGALVTRLQAARPDVTPTTVTLASAPDAPVTVAIPQRTLYVDAYSGAVLGEGSQSVRRFMTAARAWHRWLAVDGDGRRVARWFTGWANFIFLFIVCSGFYLWFPRKWTWRHVRPVVWFTRGARGKARDFNWHNAIGMWCLVPLFIVVVSAVPISFPWANDWVYRAAGETPPAGRRGGGAGEAAAREGGRGRGAGTPRVSTEGLAGLLQRAAQQERDWRTVTVRLPESASGPVSFAIDRGDGGQPQLRSTLTLDRAGAVVRYETFADQGPGRRLRSLMRFAHTGEVLGLAGQTVAGVASAGAVVLVWTGIALALRRARAWLSRRRARALMPMAEDPAA